MATEEPTELLKALLALVRIGPPGFRVGRYLRFNPAAVQAWEAERTALDDAA
ncbi:hypothetical protein [Streptomyces hawaiiensis]|uniref:hypothetical protein n=1 Tax=Streptomyces hawaiiensis TaxID=67305 RepID=UPI001FE88EEC|nr:hypothetical protein [Streptomyces hawaiiensis]